MNLKNVLSNLSIRAKMILPILIGMTLLTSGLCYYFITTIKDNSNQVLNEIAERTTGILAHALEYSVSINNLKDSEYVVEWLITQPDIYSIKILSNNEVILHKICDHIVEEKFLHSFSKDIMLITNNDSLIFKNDITLDQSNSEIKKQKIGSVEVLVSSKTSNNKYYKWLTGALFFSISLLIISISLSLLTSSTISNSIKRIIQGINKMGDGNLSSRITYSDNKELNEIAKSFNKMADKVQHTENELNYAHKLQKRFLSTMSHDLRSPLGIMLSMIELTIKGGKLDSLSKFHLKSGYAAGKQLQNLVEDVLDIGKLEAKEEELKIENVDILTEIIDLINVQKVLVNSKTHVSINILNHSYLTLVKIDKQKTLRIISNLFSNAIKFTRDGSITVKCFLQEIDSENVMLNFEIRDTGIGIPETSIESIYQPFKQVDSDISRQYGGSGLGLSIVFEYISLMSGDISVESKIGLGTKFVFQIPLAYVKALKNTNKILSPAQDNVVVHMNKEIIKVLVIDDNKDYIEILKSYLEKDIFNIVSCSNGHEGLTAFKENRFDIVLLDCQMPFMDGFEVCEALRAFEQANDIKKTVVLAITANSKSETSEKCINAGMTDVLTKPFTEQELTQKITYLC